MKPSIKSAVVYKAKMPSAEDMRELLQAMPFVETESFAAQSSGFVPVDGDLVTSIEGGYVFAHRVDTKKVPKSLVDMEVAQACAGIEREQGYKPGRKQTKDIREQVCDTLIAKAMAVPRVTHVYYDSRNDYLIVPTSSRSTADDIIEVLVRLIQGVELRFPIDGCETRAVTEYLRSYLDGNNPEPFGFGTKVRLTDGERVVQTANMGFSEEVGSALAKGLFVDEVQLTLENLVFRVSPLSLTLKGIENTDAKTDYEHWQEEAAAQMFLVSEIINQLRATFGGQ